tara:strand:- start:119 stop:463 length:345 start_codon:yes stop_codon:yes gene_type:complete
MTFFESEVVRAELAEVSELQEEVYSNVFKFPTMSKEDQRYHVGLLEKLLEKQRVLYTRVSLSDDPEAKKMKKSILEGAVNMGLPPNIDMHVFFKNMDSMVDIMKKQIDNDQFRR